MFSPAAWWYRQLLLGRRLMGQLLHGSTTATERLCWRSSVSGPPWGGVPNDGIEDREELSHDGDKGNLLRPSARGEPIVEGPEGGAAADGGQRRHVQHVAHRGSASGNGPPAPHQAGVAVDRGDADEGSQL